MMGDTTRNVPGFKRAAGLVDATLLRFAVIGLITTVLDLVLFSLLAVGAGIYPVAANVLSYSCGVVTSFILNRSWTFGVPFGAEGMERQALRFVSTHLASLLLSSVLVALLILVLPSVAAKVVSVPIVFVWNYVIARHWVFRE